MSKETIEISLDEWNEIVNDTRFLDALYEAGVRDWDGYQRAFQIYNELLFQDWSLNDEE